MLHYKELGSGKNTLVLLHGFGESIAVWDKMTKELADHFKLVIIDLPGHGKSKLIEDYTMEEIAKEVKQVTDSLKLKQFHIVGHSMGGYIALEFAKHFASKLKSFTLFFSTYFGDSPEKKKDRKKTAEFIAKHKDKFVKDFSSGGFSKENQKKKSMMADFAKLIGKTPSETLVEATLGMMVRLNNKDVLKKFDGKILLINGREDAFVDTPKTVKELPKRDNIKSYIVDCGHHGQWELPAVCNSILKAELG